MRLNIMRRNWLKLTGQRSITVGNAIIVSDGDIDSKTGMITEGALAHEMTHVGQYQDWGALSYFGRGLYEQTTNTVGGWFGMGKNWRYRVPLPLQPGAVYGMEQQASIVEGCVTGTTPAYCAASPYQP